jgi:hypothetical protein
MSLRVEQCHLPPDTGCLEMSHATVVRD